MSEGSLRERLTTGTEDRLGRALTDLLENPILTGAIGRAFDAREKAAQAQELGLGASSASFRRSPRRSPVYARIAPPLRGRRVRDARPTPPQKNPPPSPAPR